MKYYHFYIFENQLWNYRMTKNSGIFYRGTAGKGQGTGLGALGNGVYLTWTEGMAQAFADRVGGEVKKYKVKPGLKMADAQGPEIRDIKKSMGYEPWEYSDDPMYGGMMTMELQDQGFDGAVSDKPADGIVIFDPNNIDNLKNKLHLIILIDREDDRDIAERRLDELEEKLKEPLIFEDFKNLKKL